MPLYTYRCEKGHEFEVLQPITDAPLTICEVELGEPPDRFCGEPCKRLIPRGTSFVLKGGGWTK